ncbi:hypothetical protein B0H14DRAFT_3130394 [Mycena olivaceomarginata]|nr:hypothetical protein B0H14DRAFT_3130394 [Mycena olivaceomarginata]
MSAHTLYSHFLLCVPTVSTATTATCLLRQRTVRGSLQVASRVRAKACRDIPPLLQWSKFYEAAPELSAPQGATSTAQRQCRPSFYPLSSLKVRVITSFPGSQMHALRKDFLRVCRRASLLFSKPSAVPLYLSLSLRGPRVHWWVSNGRGVSAVQCRYSISTHPIAITGDNVQYNWPGYCPDIARILRISGQYPGNIRTPDIARI